ncbi:MAG: Lrp/AsnC family transcriptional regulator [Pseudohongiella sp.]|nr:Lrp/AsnC family transcriptional regulator [Pseudohongiella sp.]MDO9519446.1 Lrp/AsnC family transcriptional regulator [Pseudohongiella sp.]MDP2127546.1 Lrp/AsnC family transcriptional regulator [Pseudohongiella sp.]
MDSQDKKLLGLMQSDASLSVAELADRTGMSKSACWRRIQKFEDTGVIRQRVTLLDPAKLGLGLTVFVTIRTNQHNAAWAEKFKAVVQGVEGVLEVYRLGGQIDYLLKAVVADMPGYDRLYQNLIEADLFDVTASFVMEEIKMTSALPL